MPPPVKVRLGLVLSCLVLSAPMLPPVQSGYACEVSALCFPAGIRVLSYCDIPSSPTGADTVTSQFSGSFPVHDYAPR
ncbi:uncharacterized protein BT62DRAFT_928351 [Guyanagaster necrorhizus]|uniref:Secreted protein n=1 Tax=Guyanagaster necrorhizus TaxID=856835 RepID=A0A9P7W0B0_9AGAR|nr:uncharacterized protein BT62DRAFT_928351 [Guyanagaster necrorhizus MCA 3950]KAG7449624.1 hypothetical protein BT62DRAFT_928351 [Guyanagaster necrorhizus MCA 3950]